MDRPVLIVVAGGASRRFGSDKMMLEIEGRPLFIHSLERLASAAGRTVLVAPPGRETEFRAALLRHLPNPEVTIVPGGPSRPESVRNGFLAARPAPDELVAIHDAARPFASAQLLSALCRRAAEVGGAVPGFPQNDAQKRVDENGLIVDDLPRENVWNVGTPQVFRAALLEKVFAAAPDPLCLDDAQAVRRVGGRVAVLPAEAPNPNITRPSDRLAFR